MLTAIRRDVQAVLDRDPAANGPLEVVLCYPGLWAVWGHRIAHRLWLADVRLPARLVSVLARWLTGIEIHPAADVGERLFIDHGMGVVIGETAQVGSDVTLYHGVTLGGTTLARGKRHPTLGDGVVVGAGAKVLGPITVGDGSRVGANAVVVKPVPPGSVVVGVPGEIIAGRPAAPASNLQHGDVPDVLGGALLALIDRVQELEHRLGVDPTGHEGPYTSDDGIWHANEDFSI